MGHAGPRTWRAGSTPCDGCGRRRRSAACGQRSARPSPAAAPGAPWHNLQECRWVRRESRAGTTARPRSCPPRTDTPAHLCAQSSGERRTATAPGATGEWAGRTLSVLVPEAQNSPRQACPVIRAGGAGKRRTERGEFEVLWGQPLEPSGRRLPPRPWASPWSLQAGAHTTLHAQNPG